LSRRKEGINIVAIHQHMTGEEPRIMFLHYWGKGEAPALARALKNVLDAQSAITTASFSKTGGRG
jgi:hypothetical protein